MSLKSQSFDLNCFVQNRRIKELIFETLDIPDPPCDLDGGCPFWSMCRDLRLACGQFANYVYAIRGHPDFYPDTVEPNHKIWRKLYVGP